MDEKAVGGLQRGHTFSCVGSKSCGGVAEGSHIFMCGLIEYKKVTRLYS